MDPVGEGEGGMFQKNSIETCILSRVKQITIPGWMHETSAWTWCTGKTQRNHRWRGRGEGGSGWGIHVNPWLILVNVRQKPLQYCKVISLQLIIIIKKNTCAESALFMLPLQLSSLLEHVNHTAVPLRGKYGIKWRSYHL